MTLAGNQALSGPERRRRITLALLRSTAVTAGLVAAYYLLPLDRLADVPIGISLAVGLAALATVSAYQVRTITRSRHPAVRAVEALSVTAPLFLLLFAAAYFLMAAGDSTAFDVPALTRTDALYFTVTVFATVGFGDITATSQTARVLVIVQMILDLIVLGAVIRIFAGAVQVGRQNLDSAPVPPTEPENNPS